MPNATAAGPALSWRVLVLGRPMHLCRDRLEAERLVEVARLFT